MPTILEQFEGSTGTLENASNEIIVIYPYHSANEINNARYLEGCFLHPGVSTPDEVVITDGMQLLIDAGKLVIV